MKTIVRDIQQDRSTSRQSYPDTRLTGVRWFSAIPFHWQTTRLRRLLRLNDGGTWGSDPTDGDAKIVLRSTDMTVDGKWAIMSPARRELTPREYESAKLATGDLVITKSSGSALHLGKTAIVTPEVKALDCCFSNFMQRLRVDADTDPKYIYWFLNSDVGREQLNYFGTTTTGLANLNGTVLGSLLTPVPPTSEQYGIAEFLDRETGKIDALIEKKERLIELLEEKRAALISHAVTKGMDPDVPMKDSGIPWIGEVPEHWETRSLKTLVSHVTSGSRGWAEYYSDDGPTFLRIGNLRRGTHQLDLSDVQHVSPPNGGEGHRTRVQVGDILVSITAYIGSIGLVSHDIGEAYVNQHIALVRPMVSRVRPGWLAMHLLGQSCKAQFDSLLYGGTKDGLGLDDVRNLRIALPPEQEQDWIVEVLEVQTRHIAHLIEKVRHHIELLREYRTALISAAVTGKIDVQDEVA